MQIIHSFTLPTRKSVWLAGLLTCGFGALPPLTSVALAQSAPTGSTTVKVSGAFVTNFISEDQTAGTVTGDLAGAIGVKVLGVVSGAIGDGKPVTLNVQHFWVTEPGDNLFLPPMEVTAYPGTSPGQPLLYSFVYEKGGKVTGGTGKFEGATGTFKVWGGIDLGAGEVTGRYRGEINFKTPTTPASSPTVGASSLREGQFRFQVKAAPGQPVTAEVSNNLKQWSPLQTLANPEGTVEFQDPGAATARERFYRARSE